MRKAIVTALIGATACLSFHLASVAAIPPINDTTFARDVLASTKPVVVDFYADWCGPCRRLSPVIEQVSSQFNGAVNFVKVNVDNSPQTAQKYHINSIPTVMVFQHGRPVDSTTGLVPEQELTSMISRALGLSQNNREVTR